MVTGGAELIGSTLAWKLIRDTPHHVHNVNVLTYAGTSTLSARRSTTRGTSSVRSTSTSPRYSPWRGHR